MSEPLPEFLRISVEKGIVDEATARRIELYRRTRGTGDPGPLSSLVTASPDPNLTFDNFLVFKGNSFAVELARTVAVRRPENLPYNPLYIYGDVGVGKTHVLSAIANAAEERSALLVNIADLEVEFERAKRVNARAELREWLISPDILLLDDIQLCEGKEDLQVEVFSVLNHMTRDSRWVGITCDVPPTQLADMESRLLSRLGGGVIVSLQMGDRADRLGLLRHFCRHNPLPDEVLEYLAQNVTANARALKAAVSQITAAVESSGSAATVDLARALVDVSETGPDHRSAPAASREDPAAAQREDAVRKVVARFKEMLEGAETEEEQALALQIAIGERIRQLRQENADPKAIERFETALEVLRNGNIQAAMSCFQ